MTKTYFKERIKKGFHAFAVLSLFLPSVMSVGTVAAEESISEDPEVEQVSVAPAQVEENELGEPQEVRTLIHVRTPNNMNNYVNTLNDFENHPLILINQVTGETFRSSVVPNEGNTSNQFTLETFVHAYERGNQPSGRYTITLPQELIDLGYSLTRDHSVQANFGIVGTTNLSYNAPQPSANVGQLSRNASDYGYVAGRNIGITLTSLDGQRTYSLGNTNMTIPSGDYNIRITNAPTDSRPQLILRESSLTNAPEREISLVQEGEAYVGTISLDFTNSTRPQIFKLSPVPLALTHTVTIDPNGGTIDEAYAVTELEEGETYTVPYTFQSGLARPGYTLTGYSVEGTLLNAAGEAVNEIGIYPNTAYTAESDVTLTANWVESYGDFVIQLHDHAPSTQPDRYTLTLVDAEGNATPLTSRSYTNNYREWRVEDISNGNYTLYIEEFNIAEAEKAGHPDTASEFVVQPDGSVAVDLTFEDDSTTTFIRYRVYGEEIVATYPLGVEVRDLTDRRTSDVGVTVTNEEGTVFEGSYDQYNLWTTAEGLVEGTYTITLTTPEGTVAEVNPTVASQMAQPTDVENVFTIDVNETTQGNLSRVFGAFRLVEIEEEPEEPEEPKKSHPVFDTHPSETKGNPHGPGGPGNGRPANPGQSNVPAHARNNRGF